MEIYDKFARIYTEGKYSDFSRRMAELLPSVFKRLDVNPKTILDLACGDGTFALAMAEKGFQVTGLDLSPRMLEFAAQRARKAKANAEFILGDMRSLKFREMFDLVTCWFDSLNYVVEPSELEDTFTGVWRALTAGGLFVFDMNTIHGLAVTWQENPSYVEQDTDRIFEIHRQEFDFETNIASMRITAFVNEHDKWTRIDEEHRERGYPQDEVRTYLNTCGFQVLASWGSFQDMSEARPDSSRVWFIAKKRST